MSCQSDRTWFLSIPVQPEVRNRFYAQPDHFSGQEPVTEIRAFQYSRWRDPQLRAARNRHLRGHRIPGATEAPRRGLSDSFRAEDWPRRYWQLAASPARRRYRNSPTNGNFRENHLPVADRSVMRVQESHSPLDSAVVKWCWECSFLLGGYRRLWHSQSSVRR